ncbi:unnamed protein product [Linum trigynum]|uniref:Uncharacterized protein n=1 Tax=Linum trigynum TaxID=586398 RepID=A0AAV2FUM5_9ROSI
MVKMWSIDSHLIQAEAYGLPQFPCRQEQIGVAGVEWWRSGRSGGGFCVKGLGRRRGDFLIWWQQNPENEEEEDEEGALFVNDNDKYQRSGYLHDYFPLRPQEDESQDRRPLRCRPHRLCRHRIFVSLFSIEAKWQGGTKPEMNSRQRKRRSRVEIRSVKCFEAGVA